MASITDIVVEGLKYPFNDLKKLLGLGVLFAVISLISVFTSVKSFDIYRATSYIVENSNATLSHLSVSQLPTGDIYMLAGLTVISFIVSLFILGYQYDIVKFSIEKKEDLPGFGNILGMLINGIKYLIVVVAYNIIPMIVLICGVIFVKDLSILAGIVIISVILFIIAYFLLIMALNNMIAHDSLKKAFSFAEITGNIANLGWGKYIGIILFTMIIYMIIMAAVSFVLSFISVALAATVSNQALIIAIIISVIEGLFIDSYGALFFNRVCGSIYNESLND